MFSIDLLPDHAGYTNIFLNFPSKQTTAARQIESLKHDEIKIFTVKFLHNNL